MSTKQDAERRFAQIEGERDYYKRMAERREQQRDRLKGALEACKASLIDAGREHSPSVARARAALEECE